ncbi:CaiB/BaiF CoA-transferase family protein [Candidatus Deferrimicrobium sp.]|uniref:CaiB/BaiF CoA transferase family protein n=1 Tax=Candidatus Deferrimicrobium sp. TaxID=3060586 RepID=UPI002ED06881
MTMLAGIRVLDLSLQLPGPFCTMMMADYGADVVKIDEPNPRVRNPFAAEEPGTGPVDRYLNRGKRSVTINLKTEEGKAIFLRLAATADVVVEGFRPGVVQRLGIDYDAVSSVNPKIIYCSISGFGQDSPMRDVPGHDINYLSYAGALGLCGRKGGDPTLLPVQLGDVFGGSMMALTGILMALLGRERTGKGRLVDISMTDGALASLVMPAASYLCGGVPQERGSLPLTGMFPCYEVYRCADGGYLSVGALEAWFWKALTSALGREDLAGKQYATGAEGESVKEELRAVFLTLSRDEWMKRLAGIDACVSPVLDFPEALAHPNASSRRMVLDVESPLGGTDRQLGMPIKIAGVPEAPRRAPLLGEHDDEILSGLGYTEERISDLRAKGVIRKR